MAFWIIGGAGCLSDATLVAHVATITWSSWSTTARQLQACGSPFHLPRHDAGRRVGAVALCLVLRVTGMLFAVLRSLIPSSPIFGFKRCRVRSDLLQPTLPKSQSLGQLIATLVFPVPAGLLLIHAKVRDAAEIRRVIRGQHPEGDGHMSPRSRVP
jgi:hypothetical protein